MAIDLTAAPEPSLLLRPRDATDDRLYNPDTDLPWCYAGLAAVALEALQLPRWEPWFANLLIEKGITEAELLEGAARFACAIKDMAADPELRTPGAAFSKHGVFSLKDEIQLVINARIGQVLTAAYFKGVRLITFPGEEPNKKLRLCELEDAAREFLRESRSRSLWFKLKNAGHYLQWLWASLTGKVAR